MMFNLFDYIQNSTNEIVFKCLIWTTCEDNNSGKIKADCECPSDWWPDFNFYDGEQKLVLSAK